MSGETKAQKQITEQTYINKHANIIVGNIYFSDFI